MMGYNEQAMADADRNQASYRRWILAFTEDLFLQPRLQDAAAQLGFECTIIDRADRFESETSRGFANRGLTEPLQGPDASLVRWLSAGHPVLLIFDASSAGLPWLHWIQVLKTSAATRRIPIVVFGPHVEERKLADARAAGADRVFPRGQFQSRLPAILQEWAEPLVHTELVNACQGPLSERAGKGIELHNRGEYFEAHEELERAWMDAGEYEGYLYRALLQVSVAHLHLERGNPAGAAKLLMRVHRWLDPLPDSCRGLDLAGLRRSVAQLRERLYHSLDRMEMSSLEFTPIRFQQARRGPEAQQGGEP
jgi:predicted metal-dependent hydrolase